MQLGKSLFSTRITQVALTMFGSINVPKNPSLESGHCKGSPLNSIVTQCAHDDFSKQLHNQLVYTWRAFAKVMKRRVKKRSLHGQSACMACHTLPEVCCYHTVANLTFGPILKAFSVKSLHYTIIA